MMESSQKKNLCLGWQAEAQSLWKIGWINLWPVRWVYALVDEKNGTPYISPNVMVCIKIQVIQTLDQLIELVQSLIWNWEM